MVCIPACLHINLIFPQHDYFEPLIMTLSKCSEHGILCWFGTGMKEIVENQTVLIFIIFLSVSVIFGRDTWEFVIPF